MRMRSAERSVSHSGRAGADGARHEVIDVTDLCAPPHLLTLLHATVCADCTDIAAACFVL